MISAIAAPPISKEAPNMDDPDVEDVSTANEPARSLLSTSLL
jgi:hypothetical protein